MRGHAAKFFVIDQFSDFRIGTTDLAVGILAQIYEIKGHIQGVEEQQAPIKGLADAQDQLQGFSCLQGTDRAGQDTQYAGRQPAYRDHGDGTVTDLNTGLMWQQSPDTDGDGLLDGQEVAAGTDPLNTTTTDPILCGNLLSGTIDASTPPSSGNASSAALPHPPSKHKTPAPITT